MKQLFVQLEEAFREKERRRAGKPRCAGAELKFPAVNGDGTAVDYDKIVKLWHFLAGEGWNLMTDPGTGDPVGATCPRANRHDIITTETGYCKLEVALAYEDNLFKLARRLEEIKRLLRRFGDREGVRFLGLGLQPVSPPGEYLMSKKSRNLFWNRVFGNDRVSLFTVSATNQAHIDVSLAEGADAVNVCNGLSGAQLALTANSAVWRGKADAEHRALAEAFWYWWLPDDPRVGMTVRPFADWEDYLRHICGFKPVFVVREGRCLGIFRYGSFTEYYQAGENAQGEDEKGSAVPLVPQYADLNRHYTFCWHDARLSEYFTLENRVNCQQPPGEELCVTALTLGLLENLPEARALVEAYPWELLRELHDAAVKHGPRARAGGTGVLKLAQRMLEISSRGLKSRGQGEETFLEPLWKRLREGRCPADDACAVAERDGIAGLVEKYSI